MDADERRERALDRMVLQPDDEYPAVEILKRPDGDAATDSAEPPVDAQE